MKTKKNRKIVLILRIAIIVLLAFYGFLILKDPKVKDYLQSELANITGDKIQISSEKQLLVDYFNEFFNVYNEKDFAKLERFLDNEMVQYVGLSETTSTKVINNLTDFFENKDYVNYKANFLDLKYGREIGSYNIEIPMTISWGWQEYDEKTELSYAYDRVVEVIAKIKLNENNKITEYHETKVIIPKLKLLKDLRLTDDIILQQDTIVESEFVTRSIEVDPPKSEMYWQKITYKDKSYWLESGYFDNETDSMVDYLLKIDEEKEEYEYLKKIESPDLVFEKGLFKTNDIGYEIMEYNKKITDDKFEIDESFNLRIKAPYDKNTIIEMGLITRIDDQYYSLDIYEKDDAWQLIEPYYLKAKYQKFDIVFILNDESRYYNSFDLVKFD